MAQVASHAPTKFNNTPATTTSKAPVNPMGKAVVSVNGTILTQYDLVREEYTIFPYAKQHGGVPKELEPGIRSGALDMIIFEELVYQDALRRKMSISDATVLKAEKEFRAQFETQEEYDRLMQEEFHGSRELLQTKIRRSFLIDEYLKKEIESKAKLTADELRSYYDSNPKLFDQPETYTFQSISFIPPANATPDQLKEVKVKADEALAKAQKTKNAEEFGLLAEKVSEDDYRVMMGQHKPMEVSAMAPDAVKAFATMKPGEITGLIPVGTAYTILRMTEHKPANHKKFEEIKDALASQLQKKKSNDMRIALDKKLRADAKIVMM
jgi:parvulin-like peptidyl-prolyl isomerase